MKIAVIGSGIAGLSCAWLLQKEHTVTLYEAATTLGMDAAGLNVDAGPEQIRVDVPLRVIHDHYYKNLLKLYSDAGIETEAVNYSGSFSMVDGPTYFRYWNLRLFNSNFPLCSPALLFQTKARKILKDYWRFSKQATSQRLNSLPLGEYLTKHQYSKSFSDDFLIPTFAAIGTCTMDQVRAYPSGVINEYLTAGGWLWGIRRAKHGSADVVKRLSQGSELLCDCPVTAIEDHSDCVTVHSSAGPRSFDHVVLATPANVSVKLVQGQDNEALKALSTFPYEKSRVLVHRDASFMPKNRSDWAPVNFMIDGSSPSPMATIWLNVAQPSLKNHTDLFQTWSPLKEVNPDLLVNETSFERPVVNSATVNALADLERLHSQSERRLWYIGSYASAGVPLLESAVTSARKLTERLKLGTCAPQS